MEFRNCIKCDAILNPSEFKHNKVICYRCNERKRVETIQSDSFLKENFEKEWSASLFKKYIFYLIDMGFSTSSIVRKTRKAMTLFRLAESTFISRKSISGEWLIDILENDPTLKNIKICMIPFLALEGIISVNNDEKYIKRCRRLIEKVPEGFKRLLEIYFNEKIEHRKRQIQQNARNPISWNTIIANLEEYTSFVRWIHLNNPQVPSWETIQQEDVHSYLLTLTMKRREIVRKDLLVLFRLAKRKRMITHIPILDIKSRELPLTIEPLTYKEQKEVATRLKLKRYEEPLACMVASFCFYHGLSSTQIRIIKVQDINLRDKQIVFKDRSPIYLTDDDLILINEYSKVRARVKNYDKRRYFILSNSANEAFHDRQVNKEYISRLVKKLTGYTPKHLRITCFAWVASHYGPQLLVEGFGLSLTQASRYGKLEDFLIEEEIKNQRSIFEDSSSSE